MNSEENNNNKKEEIKKQAWETPEIINLDVERTESGATSFIDEVTFWGAS